MTSTPKAPNLPALIAYSVVKRTPDQPINDAQWTEIGAAWSHRDGRGMTLRLTALPLAGQIYLRMPDPEGDDPRRTG
jgi:hypothetical protein